jgi:hypothetical protein
MKFPRWLLVALGVAVVGTAAVVYRSPVDMSATDRLVTALGIAAAGRNREAHNRAADQHNAAMEELGCRLGWQWQPIIGYSPPWLRWGGGR